MSTERISKLRAVAANRQPNMYIVLEQPRKPGNVAAAMRSCDAFGVTELILVDWKKGLPATDPIIQKRSVSANLWVPTTLFLSADTAATYLEFLGATSFGTTVHSDTSIDLFLTNFCLPSAFKTNTGDLSPSPVAIWFGNEAEGLTRRGHEVCGRHVFIPMLGMVESHNLATSVAIVLTEVSRQRAAFGIRSTP